MIRFSSPSERESASAVLLLSSQRIGSGTDLALNNFFRFMMAPVIGFFTSLLLPDAHPVLVCEPTCACAPYRREHSGRHGAHTSRSPAADQLRTSPTPRRIDRRRAEG